MGDIDASDSREQQPPLANDDDSASLQLAGRVYEELRRSAQSIDDQVSKLFAGIAFLASGAIAFGFSIDVFAIRYRLSDSRNIPLPALLFVGFVSLVVVGVVLLILSLFRLEVPPPLVDERLRGASWRERAMRSVESHTVPRTWIEYLDVAMRPSRVWHDDWMTTSQSSVSREVAGSYMRSAHRLGIEALAKQSRLSDARVVFTIGFVLLISGFALSANALVTSTASPVTTTELDASQIGSVPWGFAAQAIIVVTVGLFGAVVAYDRLLGQSAVDVAFTEKGRYSPYGQYGRLRWLALSPGLYALGAIGTLGGRSTSHLIVRTVLVVAATVAGQFAVFQSIRLWWQWLQFAIGGFLAAVALVAVFQGSAVLGLIGVGLSIVALELPVMMFATVTRTNIMRNAVFLFAPRIASPSLDVT